MIRLAELNDRFVAAARDLMLARGWTADPSTPLHTGTPFLGDFTRACGDGFQARVLLELESSYSGAIRGGRVRRPATLTAGARIGLEFLPASRLLRFVRARGVSAYVIDLSPLVGSARAVTPELSDLDVVDAAAGELIAAAEEGVSQVPGCGVGAVRSSRR